MPPQAMDPKRRALPKSPPPRLSSVLRTPASTKGVMGASKTARATAAKTVRAAPHLVATTTRATLRTCQHAHAKTNAGQRPDARESAQNAQHGAARTDVTRQRPMSRPSWASLS